VSFFAGNFSFVARNNPDAEIRGNPHGPPGIRSLLQLVAGKGRFTTWRTIVLTMLYLYVARNFSKLVDLESPEPLAGMYSKSFFRATYLFTALDAGYWTAMKIRNKYLREFCSVLFSGYYLIAAEAADEKVRSCMGIGGPDMLIIN